jgi:hypothetical protein
MSPSNVKTARNVSTREEPYAARPSVAASRAQLPVTSAMAWAVPQLLKRIHLFAPDVRSTNGVLRAVIDMPDLDKQFAEALASSGFLLCDQPIEFVRWKLDIAEMKAKHAAGSGAEVMEHCRGVLKRRRMKQPFDWVAVTCPLPAVPG